MFFVSVWRPIGATVEQWPLAVCDAQTVSMDDLEEMEYVTEECIRSSYLVKWNKDHRFYYLSRMNRREVCIFKIFDSAYHVAGRNGQSTGNGTQIVADLLDADMV